MEGAIRWIAEHVGVDRTEARAIINNAKDHGVTRIPVGNFLVALP